MTITNNITFVMGFGAGFYLSIYILDHYYRINTKKMLDEIHKQYKRALKNARLK